MMAERPIMFSAPMVRAILSDRKSMTRRLATSPLRRCEPGDHLWVREAFATHACAEPRVHDKGDGHPWGSPIYRATFAGGLVPECEGFTKWRPSIHMPRWASRITLEVIGVKVERLQQIGEDDARSEGCRASYPLTDDDTARKDFRSLWGELHGNGSWADNPEVIAICFRRIDPLSRESGRGGG